MSLHQSSYPLLSWEWLGCLEIKKNQMEETQTWVCQTDFKEAHLFREGDPCSGVC